MAEFRERSGAKPVPETLSGPASGLAHKHNTVPGKETPPAVLFAAGIGNENFLNPANNARDRHGPLDLGEEASAIDARGI